VDPRNHVLDGGADAPTETGTFSIGFRGIEEKGELCKNGWTDLNDLYVV